jgi:hypothetical protein
MWHVCRAAGAGRALLKYPDHIMAPLLSPLSYSDSTKMSSMKPLIRNIENGQLIQVRVIEYRTAAETRFRHPLYSNL